jgi:anti-sigma regulatory factor (Ser/Thr protein kinase)
MLPAFTGPNTCALDPGLATAEVAVACSEAFANAIEHPLDPADPSVDVEGVVSNDELVLTVSDHGGWHERRLREEGGLGLPLMRSLMGSIDVQRRPKGTTVVLRRCLRSALAAELGHVWETAQV